MISAQPGIALGEKSDSKVLVATTGRVKVKVDASKGPIHIGDLLVTSDIPGIAMKSEAINLGGVQDSPAGNIDRQSARAFGKRQGRDFGVAQFAVRLSSMNTRHNWIKIRRDEI